MEVAQHVEVGESVANTTPVTDRSRRIVLISSQGIRSINYYENNTPIPISSSRGSILTLNAARVVSKYKKNRALKSLAKRKGMNYKINCRCQPRCVVSLINEFDEHKKELVRQIGFGGILELKLTKVNRQFGAWLLSRVDPRDCTIVSDSNKVLTFSCTDVNTVFGIPFTGKAIVPCSQADVNKSKRILCELFQISHFSNVTTTFLEGILNKQYSYPLACDDKRSIQAAFVLYVMTKLLAPQSLANNISTRYIGAVADVDNILNYNWSQFVVDDLKKCAELMPKKFPKASQGSINGCILFLMTFYLDNIEFGIDELPNDTFPRISAFNDENIGTMIQADFLDKRNHGYPFPQYGKLKVREARRLIYTRLSDESHMDQESSIPSLISNQTCHDFVSQFVLSRFKSKKISAVVGSEAHALINDAVTRAVGEFNVILGDISDFVDISNNRTAIGAVHRFSKVLETTITYALCIAIKATVRNVLETNGQKNGEPNGQSEYTPINSRTVPSNHTATVLKGNDVRSTVRSTTVPPDWRNDSAMAIHPPSFDLGISQESSTTIPDYHATPLENKKLSFSTPTKSSNPTDSSNKRTPSISPCSGTRMTNQCKILLIEEYGNEDCKRRKYTIEKPPSYLLKEKTKRSIKPSKRLMSPFLTNQCPLERHDARVADALYSYIASTIDTTSLDETWLKSTYPFSISLTLRNIKETIAMDGLMDSDCLNFAIRKLYRTEIDRFRNTNYLGWRHFINQDFGMYAVAGEEFWEPTHQLAHFTGPDIVYDVTDCHMILLPVHLFNHYSLYAFDMENKKIAVLDSLSEIGPLGESRATRHEKISISVCDSIMQCMRLSIPGWDEDLEGWDYEIVENIPEQQNSIDCGFFVFNYMWNWDGHRLVNPISEDSYELRKQFMLHLLTFKDNEVTLPDYIRQQISLLRN